MSNSEPTPSVNVIRIIADQELASSHPSGKFAPGDEVFVIHNPSRPEQGALYFTRDEWEIFLAALKGGEFDDRIDGIAPSDQIAQAGSTAVAPEVTLVQDAPGQAAC